MAEEKAKAATKKVAVKKEEVILKGKTWKITKNK